MAEEISSGAAVPTGPDGRPATPPKVLPLVALFTLGRLAIAAALVGLLWLVGLGSFPGLLFGVLLSMPLSFVLLAPLRQRLTEALLARRVLRAQQKEDLRTRLKGAEGG